ncbi:MAG: c-type cytochrome, partial [Cyclobacteriaceae bacterium]|nr:c-type cytochrome [Cyclobacteriaceae bacterium]
QVFASTGGMSFKGFAKKMIERALVNIPEDQHDYYMNMTGAALAQVNDADLAELPQPEGPGRAWDEAALKEVLKDLEKGDQENGQRMYQAVLCSSCHMKNGAGSDLGPELSTLGSRFSVDDIIRSVVYPSETVSDQYATTLYVMQDSSHVQGRVLNMDGDTLFVNTNPFNARAIKKILKTDVLSEKPTTLSMMPPGLLNRLNAEEVRDLFSYLLN